ncbi:hypothetical protein Csp2054_16785 [Curtobacterium sp. 'Ferrero']|uniref:hypothetical protein n=1 Tax=Curtobacterium sp. 'Ferrero' TaxID=2033654 RepID=UPI000BC405E6|nr:hypothetical protein [Curtobacterium sp. 'Ferrero']PCN46550.1 hypothetical protein Csp2054_16785 [Curtobacterium sp. 'Ferrero']
MNTRIMGGAVIATALIGGALVAPAAASAATEVPAVSQGAVASAQPTITVDTPSTFTPYSRVTIEGTATPRSDVYLDVPGMQVSVRLRSAADGSWSYALPRVTSGNLGGNSAVVVTPTGQYAETTFSLRGAWPASGHPDAAFRPVVVTTAERTGPGSAHVSGTATPGAVVIVQADGWAQGVVTAAGDGQWSVDLQAATLPGEGTWATTSVSQIHDAGLSETYFRFAS